MTLQAHITAYLQHTVSTRRMTRETARGAEYTLRSFAKAHGARPLDQLGQATIERWMDSRSHVAAGTLRSDFSKVRNFTAWLLVSGRIKRDPFVGLEPPTVPRAVPRAMGRGDIARLLRAMAHDERAQVVLALMLYCGLRCIEVTRLSVGDYDRAAGTLFVKGKGGHERHVPVPSEARPILNRYLDSRRITAGPMIRSERHTYKGLKPSTLSNYVSEWFADAGLKLHPYDGRSAHALRHTCATDVFQRSKDLGVVSEMLGHANLATTSRYIRSTDTSRMRVAMEGRDYRSDEDPPPLRLAA